MNDLVLKYNLLDPISKKELIDFLDFLLFRRKKTSKSGLADYKKRILKVSIWSEADLNVFTLNNKLFKQWNAEDW